MRESDLKFAVATELEANGFEVYIDMYDSEKLKIFKKFKGSKNLKSLIKPDIIVFHDSEGNYPSNPFAIELKTGEKYGTINQVIEQMRGYKQDPTWIIEGKKVKIKHLFLATTSSMRDGLIYDGSRTFPRTKSADGRFAIDWALNRQLYSLTNLDGKKLYFGMLKKSKEIMFLDTPNNIYILKNGKVMWKRKEEFR